LTTVQAPALASFTYRTPNEEECLRSNVVGVTGKKPSHPVSVASKPIGTVCP
jgi:hypothetical protein